MNLGSCDMLTSTEEYKVSERKWYYRIDESEEWNFARWHRWANDERKAWGEPLLDDLDARTKWDNEIFNNLTEKDYE